MRPWIKWTLLGFVGFAALDGILSATGLQTASPPSSPSKTGDTKAVSARFEQCRATLKKAAAAGILHDLDWKTGQDPYVVVGPAYAVLHSAEKEALADNVNCFLTAGADDCISFELRDWRTEHPVAKYSLCRLEPIN